VPLKKNIADKNQEKKRNPTELLEKGGKSKKKKELRNNHGWAGGETKDKFSFAFEEKSQQEGKGP